MHGCPRCRQPIHGVDDPGSRTAPQGAGYGSDGDPLAQIQKRRMGEDLTGQCMRVIAFGLDDEHVGSRQQETLQRQIPPVTDACPRSQVLETGQLDERSTQGARPLCLSSKP